MEEIRVKTTDLTTNGDFWLLDGQPYFGKYHIWTDGKAMTGSRFNGGKSKDLKISPAARNIVEYDFLTEKNQRGGQYAMQERPLPTKSDYKKGFFLRYFLQLASDDKASVIEVKKGKYIKADSIYHKAKMRWSLNKDIKEQERLNLKNTLEVEKTFPQIRMKIYNFVEFH